jgi:hypothetical protein
MKYSHVYYRHVASISHPVLQYKQLKKALKKGPRHVEALLLADLDAIEDAIASNRMTDEELSWYSCVLYVACLKITKKIAKKLKDVGGPQIRSRALHHPAFSVLANLVLVHDRELTPSPSKLALVMCDECHEQHSSVVITDDGQTLCPPCLSALRRTDLGAKSSPCEPEALETPEAYESRRQSAIAIDRALEGTSERPTKYHIVDSERRDSLQVPPPLRGPKPGQCHTPTVRCTGQCRASAMLCHTPTHHPHRGPACSCRICDANGLTSATPGPGPPLQGNSLQEEKRLRVMTFNICVANMPYSRGSVPSVLSFLGFGRYVCTGTCAHNCARTRPHLLPQANSAPGGRARPRQPNKTLPHPRQKL